MADVDTQLHDPSRTRVRSLQAALDYEMARAMQAESALQDIRSVVMFSNHNVREQVDGVLESYWGRRKAIDRAMAGPAV
jgi:hypothetical protein